MNSGSETDVRSSYPSPCGVVGVNVPPWFVPMNRLRFRIVRARATIPVFSLFPHFVKKKTPREMEPKGTSRS